jgi:hypothetical protein
MVVAREIESIDELVATGVEGTPLIERTPQAYERMQEDARRALSEFRTDGGVAVPLEGHVIAARPKVRSTQTA